MEKEMTKRSQIEIKPRCKWCKNEATQADWREIDGQTSKINTCDACAVVSTKELLDRSRISFPDRSKLISLGKYHKDGGQLTPGMELIVERNFRSELKPAILKSWNIGHVPMDLTGYGKYAVSSAQIEFFGKVMSWPFSMIYIKP